MAKTNWIAGAMGKKGSLHEELGIPLGQKIPVAVLQAAAKKPGLVGQRARLALTLESFHHSSPKSRANAVVKKVKSARKSAAPAPAAGQETHPKFGSPEWDAKYHIKKFGQK